MNSGEAAATDNEYGPSTVSYEMDNDSRRQFSRRRYEDESVGGWWKIDKDEKMILVESYVPSQENSYSISISHSYEGSDASSDQTIGIKIETTCDPMMMLQQCSHANRTLKR